MTLALGFAKPHIAQHGEYQNHTTPIQRVKVLLHAETGRRVHIAGSANPTDSDPELLRWTHELVERFVLEHVTAGGTVLVQVGEDPMRQAGSRLRAIFDWTVMECCLKALRGGSAVPNSAGRPLVYAICTDSGRRAVSAENEQTLTELRGLGALNVEQLPDFWRFGALIRQTQVARGDVLLTIGGGVGVEHLAELYAEKQNPVIPLDIDIGSFHNDSPRGGAWLAAEARSHPGRFLDVVGSMTAAAHLDGLRTHPHRPTPAAIASRLTALLASLRPKQVFYIRLLDRDSPLFVDVEWFFRTVVDPVVGERGFQRLEVGTDPQRHGFINVEIFRGLHFSPITIADMTDQRPNCAIELGYALGRGHTVILTARRSEKLPFDVDKLPFLFWSREESTQDLQRALHNYWDRQSGRPPIVANGR